MRPQIILLRSGTDQSQGKGQLISNINACQAVVEAVRTTLGPRGMDKLIHTGTKVREMYRSGVLWLEGGRSWKGTAWCVP
jgi:hypothetical protein